MHPINRTLVSFISATTAASVLLAGSLYYITHRQVADAYDTDTSVPQVQARPADSFVESMGVEDHFVSTAIPTEQVYAAFAESGLRYMRDDIGTPYDQFMTYGNDWIQRIQHLKQMGVSTLATASINVTPADIVRYIHAANDSLPNTIYAVDGPNEVDFGCFPDGEFTGNIWVQCIPTSRWLNPTEAYMQGLHQTMRADSALQNVSIYSPSINSINFGINSTIKNNSDYANLHYYPILTTPWLNDSFANQLAGAAQFYGSTKPVVFTEIGYPSAPLDQFRPSTEETQAEILPLYYLQAYKMGVTRVFIYDLVEEGADGSIGMIKQNGQRKKSFYAIKNLITTLKDPGPAFQAGKVRYELTGKGSDKVTSQLFQKRDGSYYLALWQPQNTSSPAPVAGGEAASTISVGIKFGTALDSVGAIDTTNSPDVTHTYDHPTNLTDVAVGYAPVFFKIQASAEPTPPPDPSPSPPPTPDNGGGQFSPPPSPSASPRGGHLPTPTPTPQSTPPPTPTPTPTPEPVRKTPRVSRLWLLIYQVLSGKL